MIPSLGNEVSHSKRPRNQSRGSDSINRFARRAPRVRRLPVVEVEEGNASNPRLRARGGHGAVLPPSPVKPGLRVSVAVDIGSLVDAERTVDLFNRVADDVHNSEPGSLNVQMKFVVARRVHLGLQSANSPMFADDNR